MGPHKQNCCPGGAAHKQKYDQGGFPQAAHKQKYDQGGSPQADLLPRRLLRSTNTTREVPHRQISYQGGSSQADFMPEMLPTGELHARRVPMNTFVVQEACHKQNGCPGGSKQVSCRGGFRRLTLAVEPGGSTRAEAARSPPQAELRPRRLATRRIATNAAHH